MKYPALKDIPLRLYPWFLNLQLVSILLPLVSYPYLLRIIGPEKYGIIAVANSFGLIVTTISDYGYGFLGVNDVAKISGDPSKLSAYFSKAIVTRSAIFVLLCVLCAPLFFYIPFLSSELILFSLTLIGVFPALLFPQWLYIGLQEVRRLNYFSLLQRVVNVALVFIIIRKGSDYKIYPIVNIIPGIIAALISMNYCRNRGIVVQLSPKLGLYSELKGGFYTFISQSMTSIYAQINPILLMVFLRNPVAVGYYAVGERIVLLYRGLFSPLNQLYLPALSKQYLEDPISALRQTKEYAKIVFIINTIGAILLILFAETFVSLIAGKSYGNSTVVIYVLSPMIIFVALNNLAGVHVLLNLNKNKEFFIGIFSGIVVHLFLIAILSPTFSYLSAAIGWSVSEAVVLFVFAYFIFKKKIV